ncbi:MAG: hypothetical protein R2737_17695 [Candidatus Nanopelagicales bacterium]
MVAVTLAALLLALLKAPPAHACQPGQVEVSPGLCIGTISGDPIVVSGLENSVIGDPVKNGAWLPLEDEARKAVAALHGVPNDFRINWWARDEIRSQMFNRLLAIAGKTGANRTPAEQAALVRFQTLVKDLRVKVAQQAKAEYDRWNANPCTYQPPAGFDRYDPGAFCIGTSPANLVGTAPTPSADQFTAYAAMKVYGELLPGADGAAVARATALGIGFLSAVAAAGLIAGAAAAAAVAIPAVTAAVVSAVGSFALVPVFTAAAAGSAAGTLGTTALIPGAAGIVTAGVVFATVAIAIICIVGIILQSINVFGALEVPNKLDKSIEEAAAATPDIAAMVGDPKDLATLYFVFLAQTLPDRKDSIIGKKPVGAHDPAVDPTWQLTPQGGGSPGRGSTMAVKVWDDAENPLAWHWETVYVHDGWFVRQPYGEPQRYALSLPYIDPTGASKVAWIRNDSGHTTFVITGVAPETGAVLPDTGCSGQPDCNQSDTLDVVEQTYGAAAATLVPNDPPTVVLKASSPAQPLEGTPFSLLAEGSDPNGDPLTYQWTITLPDTGSSNIICFPGPCAPPTVTRTGPNPTVTLAQGTYPVTVTVADSSGATGSASGSITVANVAPTLHLNYAAIDTCSGGICLPSIQIPAGDRRSVTEGGQQVEVRAQVTDPGNDTGVLRVDWGDGTVQDVGYPCAPGDARCEPTNFVNCPEYTGPDTCPGTLVLLKHRYADDPAGTPDTYPITVRATDKDGGQSTVESATASVANAAPTVTVGGPADELDISETGTARVQVRVDDPGPDAGTLRVTWGDGSKQDVDYQTADLGSDLVLEHTYADDPAGTPDTYPITVRAIEKDGGESATETTTATVANVAPTVTEVAGSSQVPARVAAVLSFNATDPSLPDVEAGLTFVVDWGDGTVDRTDNPTARHIYGRSGAGRTFTVTVRAQDKDGGTSAAVTHTIEVAPLPPLAPVTPSDDSGSTPPSQESPADTPAPPGDGGTPAGGPVTGPTDDPAKPVVLSVWGRTVVAATWTAKGLRITWERTDGTLSITGFAVQVRTAGTGWKTLKKSGALARVFLWRKGNPAHPYVVRVAPLNGEAYGPWVKVKAPRAQTT